MGIGAVLAGLVGGFSTIVYPDNMGLLRTTRVGSRFGTAAAGVLLIVLGACVKFDMLLVLVPLPVVSAVATLLFGVVFMHGVHMLASVQWDDRKLMVAGLAMLIGLGGLFIAPDVMQTMPVVVRLLVQQPVISGGLPRWWCSTRCCAPSRRRRRRSTCRRRRSPSSTSSIKQIDVRKDDGQRQENPNRCRTEERAGTEGKEHFGCSLDQGGGQRDTRRRRARELQPGRGPEDGFPGVPGQLERDFREQGQGEEEAEAETVKRRRVPNWNALQLSWFRAFLGGGPASTPDQVRGRLGPERALVSAEP